MLRQRRRCGRQARYCRRDRWRNRRGDRSYQCGDRRCNHRGGRQHLHGQRRAGVPHRVEALRTLRPDLVSKGRRHRSRERRCRNALDNWRRRRVHARGHLHRIPSRRADMHSRRQSTARNHNRLYSDDGLDPVHAAANSSSCSSEAGIRMLLLRGRCLVSRLRHLQHQCLVALRRRGLRGPVVGDLSLGLPGHGRAVDVVGDAGGRGQGRGVSGRRLHRGRRGQLRHLRLLGCRRRGRRFGR
mmetsp:Transcript_101033/g.263912  ORF Transcript_101033/g.263912 Transcript_101033/m.263912 type:complete len:242 (-) Transcript_101033:509-1234(-)